MSMPTSLMRYLLWRRPTAQNRVAAPDTLNSRVSNSSTEEGVSLLECLMAIAVIILTVAMITPPLFIATATRVQNRRAEQALQIAQGELDRIQVLVAQSKHTPDRLPQATGLNTAPPGGLASALKTVNTSCTGARYNDEQVAANVALPVDIDGDCQADFLMQTFRTAGTIPSGDNSRLRPGGRNRPTNFVIGVRVYSFLANGNWANLRADQASLQLTNGLGSQRTRPLSVLYTTMNWSDQSFNTCVIQNPNSQACN